VYARPRLNQSPLDPLIDDLLSSSDDERTVIDLSLGPVEGSASKSSAVVEVSSTLANQFKCLGKILKRKASDVVADTG